MIVEELITRLVLKDESKAGLKQAEANMQRLAEKAQAADAQVKRFAKGLKAAFAGIAAGVGITGLNALIKLGDEYTTLNAKVQGFGSSMERVKKLAKDVGTDLGTVARAMGTLGNTGMKGTTLETVAQTAVAGVMASGGGNAEIASLTTQLSQALNKGVLRGQEFLNLMENAPVLAGALAKAIIGPAGTKAALMKMAEAGQLTAQTVIPALVKVNKEMRGEAGKSPRTVAQAWSDLAGEIQHAWGQLWVGTGAGAAIVRMLDAVTSRLAAFTQFVQAHSQQIRRLVLSVGAAMAVVFGVRAITWILATGRAFLAFGNLVLAGMRKTVVLGIIALILEDILTWIEGGESLFKDLFQQIREGVQPAWNKLKGFYDFLADKVTGVVRTLTEAFRTVADAIQGAFSGNFSGFMKMLEGVRDAFVNMLPDWAKKWLNDGKATIEMVGDPVGKGIEAVPPPPEQRPYLPAGAAFRAGNTVNITQNINAPMTSNQARQAAYAGTAALGNAAMGYAQ